jgi:multidrug transporter EmrE-like cation transporter
VNFVLILASVLLNAVAQIFLKKGMLAVGKLSFALKTVIAAIPSIAANPYIWGGFLSFGLSVFTWLIVLSRVEVSYAYPFSSIGYIVTTIAGYLLLGESLTLYKLAGIAVICIGICILARG